MSPVVLEPETPEYTSERAIASGMHYLVRRGEHGDA